MDGICDCLSCSTSSLLSKRVSTCINFRFAGESDADDGDGDDSEFGGAELVVVVVVDDNVVDDDDDFEDANDDFDVVVDDFDVVVGDESILFTIIGDDCVLSVEAATRISSEGVSDFDMADVGDKIVGV